MSKRAVLSASLTGLLLGILFWASPYWAVSGLIAAASARDAELIRDYVDFERLKQSVKGQISASLRSEITKDSTSGWEAVGLALRSVIVDPVVDTLLTPEFLAKSLGDGLQDVNASRLDIVTRLIGSGDAGWLNDSAFRVKVDKTTNMTWRREGLTWRLTNVTLQLEDKFH